MIDRELLEYAAKSIDLEYEWKHDAYFGGEVGVMNQLEPEFVTMDFLW